MVVMGVFLRVELECLRVRRLVFWVTSLVGFALGTSSDVVAMRRRASRKGLLDARQGRLVLGSARLGLAMDRLDLAMARLGLAMDRFDLASDRLDVEVARLDLALDR